MGSRRGAAFIERIEALAREREWKREHNAAQRRMTVVTIASVQQAVEQTYAVSIERKTWRSEEARIAFALLARRHAIARFGEIASILGVSISGARALMGRAELRAQGDESFRERLDEVVVRVQKTNRQRGVRGSALVVE